MFGYCVVVAMQSSSRGWAPLLFISVVLSVAQDFGVSFLVPSSNVSEGHWPRRD